MVVSVHFETESQKPMYSPRLLRRRSVLRQERRRVLCAELKREDFVNTRSKNGRNVMFHVKQETNGMKWRGKQTENDAAALPKNKAN